MEKIVSYFFLSVVCATLFTGIGFAFADIIVSFDDFDYFFDHWATITVTDTSSTPPGSMPLKVNSTTDSTGGISLQLSKIPNTNPAKYVAYINFTNHASSGNHLKASFGDSITAWANNNLTNKIGAEVFNPNESLIITGSPGPITNQIIPCASGDNEPSGGDGICDDWEKSFGLFISANGKFWMWRCGTAQGQDPICPSPNQKDLYLELDYYEDHYPDPDAIANVKDSFDKNGIKLHVQIDDNLGRHNSTSTVPTAANTGNTDYDRIKKQYFGTASDRAPLNAQILTNKFNAFHYGLILHNNKDNIGSSGGAELPGNDLWLTLGNFSLGVGSSAQQAGTLLHEIGHNLKLKHGGDDSINCKPNYYSVMSYSRQFPNYLENRPLNYSHGGKMELNETQLNETKGVGALGHNTGIVSGYNEHVETQTIPKDSTWPDGVDWNADGSVQKSPLLNLSTRSLGISDCQDNTSSNSIKDYNDYSLLKFDMQNYGSYADGFGSSPTISIQVDTRLGSALTSVTLEPHEVPSEMTIDDHNNLLKKRLTKLYKTSEMTAEQHNSLLDALDRNDIQKLKKLIKDHCDNTGSCPSIHDPIAAHSADSILRTFDKLYKHGDTESIKKEKKEKEKNFLSIKEEVKDGKKIKTAKVLGTVKQIKNGVPTEATICSFDKIQVFRHDSHPICLNFDSFKRYIEKLPETVDNFNTEYYCTMNEFLETHYPGNSVESHDLEKVLDKTKKKAVICS